MTGRGAATEEEDVKRQYKKNRKARTAFSDQQLGALEHSFDRQKYLSVHDRKELASRLHLSDTQVKTWYQNRRLIRLLYFSGSHSYAERKVRLTVTDVAWSVCLSVPTVSPTITAEPIEVPFRVGSGGH